MLSNREDLTWHATAFLFDFCTGEKFQCLDPALAIPEQGVRTRPGIICTHGAFNFHGRQIPVNQSVRSLQLGSIRRQIFVLARSRSRSGFDGMDHVHQHIGGQIRENIMHHPAGFLAHQRKRHGLDDIPGVQFANHMHNRHPRGGVSFLNGGGDTGRATVPRQDRGMGIDAAQRGHGDHFLGENLSISHHNDKVRLQLRQRLDSLRLSKRFWLQDRNIRILGHHFECRRSHDLMPSDRTIRLRHETNDIGLVQ